MVNLMDLMKQQVTKLKSFSYLAVGLKTVVSQALLMTRMEIRYLIFLAHGLIISQLKIQMETLKKFGVALSQ